MYWYDICGLTVCSEPSLLAYETDNRDVDVTIKFGEMPYIDEEALYKDVGSTIYSTSSIVKIRDLAVFHIDLGKDIRIELLDEKDQREFKRFLLAIVMDHVMLQRHIFPFHGNGLSFLDNGCLICGDSGAGKSSLSMELIMQGGKMISDDCTRIIINEKLLICPYTKVMKLTVDIAKKYGLDNVGLEKVSAYFDKYYLKDDQYFTRSETWLKFVFILEESETEMVTCRKLGLADSISDLLRHSINHYAVKSLGIESKEFSFIEAIIRETSIYKIQRPRGKDTLEEQRRIIEEIVGGR